MTIFSFEEEVPKDSRKQNYASYFESDLNKIYSKRRRQIVSKHRKTEEKEILQLNKLIYEN